jgi:hypothetical protein
MEIFIRPFLICFSIIFLFLLLFCTQYYFVKRYFSPNPLIISKLTITILISSGLFIYVIFSVLIVIIGVNTFSELAAESVLLGFSVLTVAGLAGLAYSVTGLPIQMKTALLVRYGVKAQAIVSESVRRNNKFHVFYRTSLSIPSNMGVIMKDVQLKKQLDIGEVVTIIQLPYRPEIFELENKDIVLIYE